MCEWLKKVNTSCRMMCSLTMELSGKTFHGQNKVALYETPEEMVTGKNKESFHVKKASRRILQL